MNASTKEKILLISRDLFAAKGFDGVSVREICQQAQVNISSINYHFENKLGLFSETISWSMKRLIDGIDGLYEKNKDISLEEFLVNMFRYFIENEIDFISSFKFLMAMSEHFQEFNFDFIKNDGPPGGDIVKEIIKRDFPKARHEDLSYAERTLLSLVFHMPLKICNDCIINKDEKFGISPDVLEKDLRRTTKIILALF